MSDETTALSVGILAGEAERAAEAAAERAWLADEDLPGVGDEGLGGIRGG